MDRCTKYSIILYQENQIDTHIIKLYSRKVGHPGLEPGTNRLKAEYSTIELVTRNLFLCRYFIFFSRKIQVKN
jgi:hypothetical protein